MTFGCRAAARLLAGLLMVLVLGGCAALKDMTSGNGDAAAERETAAAAAAADTRPPAPAYPALVVTAPPDLKRLLERYLDLARVSAFAGDDTIDDAEWARLIDAAPSQVHELLQTEGYFESKVDVSQIPGGNGQPRRVVLDVTPGVRVQVARVTVEFEGDIERAAAAGEAHAARTVADVRAAWLLGPGQSFRNPTWSDAKAAALARLRAAGYALANWTGTGAEVDAPQHTARLFVVADSGPLFRYGELQIEGLAAHDSQTVQNLATFDTGTPVTEPLLLDYQERLQKSGLFDSATVTLDPDPDNAAKARILVRVTEAPLQVYTFGVGISANTGPRASVEHVYRRVFGRALTSRNKLEIGGLRQAWDGEISSHPGPRLWRNLIGGTVERLESDDDVVLSQRLRVGRTQDMQRIERLYYVEAERSSRETTIGDSVKTDTTALSGNAHFVWRKLDNLILPTAGYSLSVQGGAGYAYSKDADSGPFSRLYSRLTAYVPVGRNWYGQGRIELGHVLKRDAVAVPDSQLFRAGGDDSVRGYTYRSLGPLVDGAVAGGTSLVTASVEMARPILASLPLVWGAVFVDVGNASNDNLGSMHLALGTGVGVRWRSPVGPLRLDLAYGRDERQLKVHFSVGVAF